MKPLLAIFVLACTASVAHAVERFAVVIGNNAGNGGDLELRYAHADARKMYDVLTGVGGFLPENVILLEGKHAQDVRRTLITVNDRIRTRYPLRDSMLLVYYSGHATADELHLGTSSLAISELESLVRGSSATIRMLVLDSCRSGSLTRVKGGETGPPVTVQLDDKLAGEGVVFLTASSANEDAQESDQLRGSFFTHYLVSALLGAGDDNADGVVTLEEAYRSAYHATLRASSQTLALQHPTFRYDVKGQGDIVLAKLRSTARGSLAFPAKRTYLVFRGNKNGPVVAEINAFDKTRSIYVEPGTYFIRGRGPDFALEGTVSVQASRAVAVRDETLERTTYARLVRKGLGLPSVDAVRGGYLARTAMASGESICHGAFLEAQRSFSSFSAAARASACRSTFANDIVDANSDDFAIELRLARPFDVQFVTIEPGFTLGAGVRHQTFTTRADAPGRWSAFGKFAASAAFVVDTKAGRHVVLDVGVESLVFESEAMETNHSLAATLAVRASFGIGAYF